MTIDLTQIAVALIGLCGAVITGFLIPWVKSKTTAQQQNIIELAAKTAVYAAQQLFTNNNEKKEYAFDYMESILAQYNLSLDVSTVSASIEAALKEVKTAVQADGGEW